MTTRARKGTRTPPQNAEVVRVRMYNVGFGDAFLMSIPDGEKRRTVLVDCGSIAADGTPMKTVVTNIIKAVTTNGKARIDVVVATHRHRDHISGFAFPQWNDVEVGEVWMPWTEHPTEPVATSIRERQLRLAESLTLRLTARLNARRASQTETEKLMRFQDLALNARRNDDAMRTLHHGFAGSPRRRFLPETEALATTLTTDHLPGVIAHILGPSRNEEIIRDVNPPKGESYLWMSAGTGQPGDAPEPFAEKWMIAERALTKALAHLKLSAADKAALESVGSDIIPDLAVALDQAINGTSLFLVLQVRGKLFLFPGDAQWGTWDAVMSNPETAELVTRATFLKVGHHGSHNATPRRFVDALPKQDRVAMVSTREMTKWPDIPRTPLLGELARKEVAIARSDREKEAPDSEFLVEHGSYIEAVIPL